MPTLEALFAEICAHPTDMEPRREYAKLVGGERGRLIDVQLQSDAQLKAGGTGIAVGGILHEGKPDREAFMRNWARPLPNEVRSLEFIRGFVESAEVDCRWLLRNHDLLFTSAPIRHLGLSGIDDPVVLDQVFELPQLQQVVVLLFPGRQPEYVLNRVAQAKTLNNILYIWHPDDRFSDESLFLALKSLPSLDYFACDAFAETPVRDFVDHAIVDLIPSARLSKFESIYGYHGVLHPPDGHIDTHKY